VADAVPDRDDREHDRHQAHRIGVNERERGRPLLKSAAPQASRMHGRDRIAANRAARRRGESGRAAGLKVVGRVANRDRDFTY
jgi:hypothetical protein